MSQVNQTYFSQRGLEVSSRPSLYERIEKASLPRIIKVILFALHWFVTIISCGYHHKKSGPRKIEAQVEVALNRGQIPIEKAKSPRREREHKVPHQVGGQKKDEHLKPSAFPSAKKISLDDARDEKPASIQEGSQVSIHPKISFKTVAAIVRILSHMANSPPLTIQGRVKSDQKICIDDPQNNIFTFIEVVIKDNTARAHMKAVLKRRDFFAVVPNEYGKRVAHSFKTEKDKCSTQFYSRIYEMADFLNLNRSDLQTKANEAIKKGNAKEFLQFLVSAYQPSA